MHGSSNDGSGRAFPIADADIGYPEGSTPLDCLESILSHARDVVGGKEVLLLVPPDRMPPFLRGRRSTDDPVTIAPGLSLSCSDDVIEALLADAQGDTSIVSPDASRLVVVTPSGALVVSSLEHLAEWEPSTEAVMRLLSTYAASTVAWASQLHEAERRAAAGEEAQHELRRECARLRELSEIDELTGLYNRRFFKRHLEREVRRFQRYGHPLALALFDVDFFKEVNDSHGHAVGDEALCHISQTALSTLRESDLIARVGGDEFAVLMPDTPSSGGLRAAERLLSAVTTTPLSTDEVSLTISISVGVAGIEERGAADPVSFFKSADAALYRAKELGRGRVVVQRPTILP